MDDDRKSFKNMQIYSKIFGIIITDGINIGILGKTSFQ